jgi:hypothetical protein
MLPIFEKIPMILGGLAVLIGIMLALYHGYHTWRQHWWQQRTPQQLTETMKNPSPEFAQQVYADMQPGLAANKNYHMHMVGAGAVLIALGVVLLCSG